MKILYHTGQLKSHGGIEKTLACKVNYFSTQLKQDVYLLTYEQGSAPYIYSINNQVHKHDIEIDYNVDYTKEKLFSIKNIQKIVLHCYRLRKEIKIIKPDIIIIPNFGFEFYFLPFISSKTPIIREFHDSQFNRENKCKRSFSHKIKNSIDLFIENKYNKLIVLTPDEFKYIKSSNVICIPNALKIEQQVFVKPVRARIVIAAGRLNQVKGFDNLINIWKDIKRQDPSWLLYIFGDGDDNYKDYLQLLIRNNDLSEHVFLKGSSSDLDSEFLKASIFVCASHTESFGMVLIEAMNCGLPVVSYDCPFGPRYIVENSIDGFLVDNQNEEQFKKALIKLMQSKELRTSMSINAKKKALIYSEDRIMNKWLDLFNKVINK